MSRNNVETGKFCPCLKGKLLFSRKMMKKRRCVDFCVSSARRVIHAPRERKKKNHFHDHDFANTSLLLFPATKILNLLRPAKGSSSLQKLFFGRRPFFLSFLLSAAYIREEEEKRRRRITFFAVSRVSGSSSLFSRRARAAFEAGINAQPGRGPFLSFLRISFCVQDQVGTALFYY